ncbi:MAG: protein phosphatase 2C domain-containing protein [Armatimonadetes bacterium]|nr:protein phosphatase 2C domain-containing protein [Armatimonadota bacterium]
MRASRASGWSFATAVRKGAVHGLEEGGQDRAAAESSGPLLAAVVSDGAGSAPYGAIGAEAVVDAFLSGVRLLGDRPTLAGRSRVLSLFRSVLAEVEARAVQIDASVSDLSCTLVGVVATPHGCLVVQVGDGAAVVETGAGFFIPVAPLRSEHVNETVFVTSPDAESRLATAKVRESVRSVTLLSDGLQDSVISPKDGRPHDPFFRSVTDRLTDKSGPDGPACEWLASVLASPQVTTRTDDDTSLIVARVVP